jgi:hypothetical protein
MMGKKASIEDLQQYAAAFIVQIHLDGPRISFHLSITLLCFLHIEEEMLEFFGPITNVS